MLKPIFVPAASKVVKRNSKITKKILTNSPVLKGFYFCFFSERNAGLVSPLSAL
jgi:hypothetical protein